MGDIVSLRGLRFSNGRHTPNELELLESWIHEQHNEGTLDEAIIKVMTLAGDELLPTINLAHRLASEAEDQKDQALFYKHIMMLHAITSRILLESGRL